MEAYQRLEKVFERVYRFEHLRNLAGWDARVMMPPKGSASRGEALAAVGELVNEMMSDPVVHQSLLEAEKKKAELSLLQQANLREMKLTHLGITAVPKDLAAKKTIATNEANHIWQEARSKNDFNSFLPVLKNVLALTREEAKYRMEATGASSMYEALLQIYEPGMPLSKVEEIFADIKEWLPGLIGKVMKKQESQVLVHPKPPFAKENQKELSQALMKLWKFDFDAGRLDVSTHPFTGMTKEDTRITTRFSDDIFSNIYATIHETGHAKYEQNCGPRQMVGQPVCSYRSLGIHESQSLFADRMIARDKKFAKILIPLVTQHLGSQPAFDEKNFIACVHAVKPGFIRVEADEVCYPLHVILRFEIEKALVEGTMEAEDVPRVWNEKMKEYLGLETLGKDNLGCLQDVHWSMGGMGYFPTYALGAMFAAQLMHTIRKELGSDVVDKAIESGELEPLFQKQKEKIWDNGCIYLTEELMVKATGEPLNPFYFRQHVIERYLGPDSHL